MGPNDPGCTEKTLYRIWKVLLHLIGTAEKNLHKLSFNRNFPGLVEILMPADECSDNILIIFSYFDDIGPSIIKCWVIRKVNSYRQV
jgi:hypothetical protein